jgi:ABC-2 type transport system ATP-binding protein
MEKQQSTSSTIFEIRHLNFSYDTKPVLSDFSFTLKEGTVHGILGDNGAGKTTLFNLLYGTIPSDNHELSMIDRTEIAFLETDTYIYPYMTGEEYLSLIQYQNKQEMEKWNEIFELPLNEYAHNYSTGMKKKLLLLGVLLLNKKIVILDEPFNGLDLKTSEIIHYIIQRLKTTGKTLILSSHILETVISNADVISYLENGTILRTFEKHEFELLSEFVKSKFRMNVVSKIDNLIS